MRRSVASPAGPPTWVGIPPAGAISHLRRAAAGVARVVAIGLPLALAAGATPSGAVYLEQRYIATTLPAVPALDAAGLFLDHTPVPLTVTASWVKVPRIATRDAVRSDATLWRQMHVEDWDTVPTVLQREALDAMLEKYRHVLADPAVWDRMSPADWDLVPQPIRTLAFRHMVEYWSGFYQVGSEYGLPRKTVADTLAALIMSESWFDHRAINVNPWGNRDLGVAQASDSARARMRVLCEDGFVDLRMDDDDYFDPWKGTRFVALWVVLMLDEVDGDLDAAVRAYHRGAPAALRGEGGEYLAGAQRRLRQYIRNEGTAGAWDYLWHRDRALMAVARPWTTSPPALTVVGQGS